MLLTTGSRKASWTGLPPGGSIGAELNRSYGAVKKRLQKKGITSRANQGYLSAGELARLVGCSYSRVLSYCSSGRIPARYQPKFNRWDIDLKLITPDIRQQLLAERRTHKTWPVDKGDYYRRYNLRRRLINGRLKVVSV
jgi:hypothetical protein